MQDDYATQLRGAQQQLMQTVQAGVIPPEELLKQVYAFQRETRVGSIEMITSSKPIRSSASRMAENGSWAPITATTSDPAARESNGTAAAIRRSAARCPGSPGVPT